MNHKNNTKMSNSDSNAEYVSLLAKIGASNEKCVCFNGVVEMISSNDGDDECPYRGGIALHNGFTSMGIPYAERRRLISSWSADLGKDVTDWLDHDQWYMYLYYKFMSWRIITALKPQS